MVNIELDDGNFQVNIYDGDKIEQVVKTFCQEKQINDNLQKKILKNVEEQIKISIAQNGKGLMFRKKGLSTK